MRLFSKRPLESWSVCPHMSEELDGKEKDLREKVIWRGDM